LPHILQNHMCLTGVSMLATAAILGFMHMLPGSEQPSVRSSTRIDFDSKRVNCIFLHYGPSLD
jgi:hypothetical protein